MTRRILGKNWTRLAFLSVIVIIGLAFRLQSDQGKYFEISKNIEIFTNLYKEINTYYVDDLDPSKLMRTGVDAMLESLDPYTNYITESQIEGYRFISEGRYNGIGAKMELIRNFSTITETYKDAPANLAGLKPGDQIVGVSGKSAEGKTPEELNEILKGSPGTAIELSIRRPGTAKDLLITLKRDEVRVPNVPYYGMVSEDIGYISLTVFTREAGQNVANALRSLKEENPQLKGVIFDLRGNGGGLLAEAVNISNVFVPRGELVVTTKGKVQDWDRSFQTQNSPIDQEIPLVVLVNKSSASASEIVSGVMQDLDRGVLMGQRSYGKGLVQNTRDIGYNSKVKMTTAKYYIPSGRCIQSVEYENGEPVDIPEKNRAKFRTRNGRVVLDGGGVKPDVVIPAPEDDPIVANLIKEHLIFDFVTEYCLKLDGVEELESFRFTDWDGFKKFLNERNYTYQSESEKLLESLELKAAEEGFEIDKTIALLEETLEAEKEGALEAAREGLIKIIEKEIAGRFFYQEGKVRMGLRNDTEIKEAVELLNNQAEYNKLLEG